MELPCLCEDRISRPLPPGRLVAARTMPQVVIRDEAPADLEAIDAVLAAAFGGEDEVRLVRALRSTGELACSLVVDLAGEIGGHLAFEELRIEPMPAAPVWALAPLAVLPEQQRRGLGSRLVVAGLERARAAGVGAVVVLGDPAYYERFGFRGELVRALRTPWDGPHLMGLLLREGPAPAGTARYPDAFFG